MLRSVVGQIYYVSRLANFVPIDIYLQPSSCLHFGLVTICPWLHFKQTGIHHDSASSDFALLPVSPAPRLLEAWHPLSPSRLFLHTISTTAAATASPEGLEIPSLNTTYAYRWLRDACTCPSCIHPSTQQKLHRTSDIPASIAPESVEISDDGVHISWAGPDPHRSFFPRARLAAHSDPSALHSFHNDVSVARWPTASALLAASGPDLEVSYDELATPRGLLRAITQLQRTGLLFLRDVPSTDTSDANCEVRKLAAHFAELRDTFYGDVWNVKTMNEIRNIAYTSLFLGLHMDLQCVLLHRFK